MIFPHGAPQRPSVIVVEEGFGHRKAPIVIFPCGGPQLHSMRGMDGHMDGWTDGQTDGQIDE